MHFSLGRQTLFLLIYGFLAWAVEVVYYALRKKQFINKGYISLPIDFEVGLIYSNLAIILPTLGRNYFWMYLITLGNLVLVRAVLAFFCGRLTKHITWMERRTPSGTWESLLYNMLAAGGILVVYLLAQPLLIALTGSISDRVLNVIAIVAWILIVADFAAVIFAMRRGRSDFQQQMEKGKTDEMSAWISDKVWARLERAYPGIQDEAPKEEFAFAKGMSLDKLVWVFLISAFVGDIIETFFVHMVSGKWMSRSSVVFGPFSFVWGIGAVLLTVSLNRLKNKNGVWIVLAGAVLGGAFEYMCSVFTEVFLGKVFWDYSSNPTNIGGRTNALFMFYWGILGLAWVKFIYPRLEKFIEKFPPISAKIATWAIIVLMGLNALLTVSVMLRYNEREEGEAPSNVLEEFIDSTYDDAYVEKRWPNMR